MKLAKWMTAAVLSTVAIAAASCSSTDEPNAKSPSVSTKESKKIAALPSPGCQAGADSTLTIAGQKLQPGTTTRIKLQVKGVDREALIRVPASVSRQPTVPLPMILGFHPYQGSAAGTARLMDFQGQRIAIYPDGLKNNKDKQAWQPAPYARPGVDDVAFISALMDQTEQSACVDLNRVSAAGYSNGGGMVSLLGCKLGSRFSALVFSSAAYYTPTFDSCQGQSAISIMDFHGTDDGVIHYNGGRKNNSNYLSAIKRVQLWAREDNCGPLELRQKNGNAIEYAATDCPEGIEVEHYRLIGGKHVWPRSDVKSKRDEVVNATAMTEQFVDTHPRQQIIAPPEM